MKRLVSTALAVVLLLGLGALAALARGGGDILTPADNINSVAAQSQTAAAPATDGPKYNMIALPLDVQANWALPTVNLSFNSHGLAQYVGLSSVDQVLHWDPALQGYDQWIPDANFPNGGYGYVGSSFVLDPWSLDTGQVYFILLNNMNSSLTRVSFVGDVPPADSIKFKLYGAVGCQYNQVSVPLERSTLTDAALLADSMGGVSNVSQVLHWDADLQSYDQWIPDAGFPNGGYGYVGSTFVLDPWSVRIGYPYVVCLLEGAQDVDWPY
jgi:hypothetical protein